VAWTNFNNVANLFAGSFKPSVAGHTEDQRVRTVARLGRRESQCEQNQNRGSAS
jgi:hypothetical protein